MGIRNELFKLQLEQLKHDQKYHKDIQVLPLHQRLNHMALHFAKYAGRVAEQDKLNDPLPLNKTIVDLFLITLATANMLNMRVADYLDIAEGGDFSSLKQLGDKLAETAANDYEDRLWLLKAVAIPSGKIAKACETLDHIEPFPYREELSENTIELCSAALIAAAKREINLPHAAKDRLKDVEKKLVFHGYV